MADAALEGVIQAIEVVKAEWALDTKMPEFTLQVQTTFTLHTAHCTLQVWAMLKVGEALHLSHLPALYMERMPKV